MDQRDVRALVVEVLSGIAPDGDFDALDPTSSLRTQLDLDSLDFMAYVERLSERTGAPIHEDEYPLVDTLDGCATLLAPAGPGR
ncbi:MAG: acyl carrier protein [Actinomycetes bacterium]